MGIRTQDWTRGAPKWAAVVVLSVLVVLLGLRLGARPGRGGQPPTARLDLNTASQEELELLPGIGPARARAIEEARSRSPLTGVDDLARVPGFDKGLIEQIRPLVRVRAEP